MLPLLLALGPVVAPLVVATLVFIVVAAITGTSIAATTGSISAPVRVGIAFLIGGFVASKAHSWTSGQINNARYRQSSASSSTSSSMPALVSVPASTSAPTGGLSPVNVPAHLMPQ